MRHRWLWGGCDWVELGWGKPGAWGSVVGNPGELVDGVNFPVYLPSTSVSMSPYCPFILPLTSEEESFWLTKAKISSFRPSSAFYIAQYFDGTLQRRAPTPLVGGVGMVDEALQEMVSLVKGGGKDKGWGEKEEIPSKEASQEPKVGCENLQWICRELQAIWCWYYEKLRGDVGEVGRSRSWGFACHGKEAWSFLLIGL